MPRIREFRWERWARWTRDQILADQPSVIALDTETTGFGFYDIAFTATVTWRGKDGQLKSGYIELDDKQARPVAGAGIQGVRDVEHNVQMLRDILNAVDVWVFHNAKFDMQKFVLAGAVTEERLWEIELHDTQTMYSLLDENGRKKLKILAVNVLGYDATIEVETKSGPNKGQKRRVPKEEYILKKTRAKHKLTKEDGYHLIPREVLIPYALKDTEFTLQLYEVLLPRLEALGDPRVLELYHEFMELKLVLLDMEADGFGVDLPYLREVTSEYGVKVMEGWMEITGLTGVDDPKLPNSPKQLLEAFAKRGVHLEDTQESTLATLDDELATVLLQYRSDKKLHTTYLTTILSEMRDGIIHPNFNEDAARTGRMSSSAASNN